MVAKQRAVDRGTERGRELVQAIGREIRLARTGLGLSIEMVAREVGISSSELSRIERHRAEWVSVITLARLCSVVGLALSARAYPGGLPLRDARHARLLEKLHSRLQPTLRWSIEVPLPNPNDQRAWDAMIKGAGWRYGIEAELNPIDGQALTRRLKIKQRDGGVDGVVLLLPDTRQVRRFRREFATLLTTDFPITSGVVLRRLATGEDPGGNAIVVL